MFLCGKKIKLPYSSSSLLECRAYLSTEFLEQTAEDLLLSADPRTTLVLDLVGTDVDVNIYTCYIIRLRLLVVHREYYGIFLYTKIFKFFNSL